MKAAQCKSLALIGTKDPRYKDYQKLLPEDSLVIDGGDHSLEIIGDTPGCVQAMQDVVAFLSQHVPDAKS
jgi:hypothetical protein